MRLKQYLSVLAAILLSGCAAEITELNNSDSIDQTLDLSVSEITLRETMTQNIVATVRPWNAADKTVEWSSSDETVASVDQSGVVTALKIGETIISAECGGLRKECKVTVVSWAIPVESLTFDYEPFIVKVGREMDFYASYEPQGTTDQFEWLSSDESVATIDASGRFNPKAPGHVTVTAKIGEFSRSVNVTVYDETYLIQTDALVKPVRFESFGPCTDTVRVARGETATVQMICGSDTPTGTLIPEVLYFAAEGQTSGLSLTPSIYWLPDITCSNKWDNWAGGPAPDRYPDSEKYLPDPLIPVNDPERGTVQLHGGDRMPLWIEFDIPRDFPAGIYDGKVRVSGSKVVECPFVIQVYDVTLPEKQEMDLIQWINDDYLQIMNNGASVNLALRDELIYGEIIPLLSRYGQNSFRLMKYDTPRHQEAYRDESGRWRIRFDFSSLDKEILELYAACPDLHKIQARTGSLLIGVEDKNIGKVWLRGVELDDNGEMDVIVNADGSYSPDICYKEQYRDEIPELKEYAQQYFMALDEFLKSKRLPDGRLYSDIFLQAICDEPNDDMAPTYEVIAGYIKEVAPDIKIVEPLGTALIGSKYIDYPCPCIDIKVFRGDGEYPWDDSCQTRWIYSAIGPQGDAINRFIRIPLIKTRMMHWLNFRYSAVGYLHWGANYWQDGKDGDPWKDAQGKYLAGDTWIIWPGFRTAYPSVRLAAMRDGIRDFELLRMLEKENPSYAMELCRKVASNYTSHNTDLQNFRDVRRTVLETLSK